MRVGEGLNGRESRGKDLSSSAGPGPGWVKGTDEMNDWASQDGRKLDVLQLQTPTPTQTQTQTQMQM